MNNKQKESSAMYDSVEVKSQTPSNKPQSPSTPRPNPIKHEENLKNRES
jgi:hypothetical protein